MRIESRLNKKSASELEAEKKAFQARLEEWVEIEKLVMQYQSQFEKDASDEAVIKSQDAIQELIVRFNPLFKKYIILLKTGQINFKDQEMKLFVYSFLDDGKLKAELKKPKQKAETRKDIYDRFNFIKETYGFLSEEEILIDLQVIFMTIAKRYKQMGRSFCGYLYNCFRFEVYRHIKKFLKNPINIPYRHTQFEDYMRFIEEPSFEEEYEDHYYEENLGIPDFNWILGETCGKMFRELTVYERKIIIKYYLEDWNDRQISEEFGIHINTVNQKRRCATMKIAKELSMNTDEIKRNRKSGKKAVMPVQN